MVLTTELDISYIIDKESRPIVPECRLYVQSVIVAISDAMKKLPDPFVQYSSYSTYRKIPTVIPKLTAFDYLYSEPYGVEESGINMSVIRDKLIAERILYPVEFLLEEVKHNSIIYNEIVKRK